MAIRTTAEMARFMLEFEALDPDDMVNAGTAGDKPGYHNSRAELLRDGLRGDYSLQHPDDRDGGPDDAGAAGDMTFRSAQGGDFRNIAKYGRRIERAFLRRDPRLRYWREVLVQADLDKAPEGFDFDGWYTRVPDATHEWHWHGSVHRRWTAYWPAYQGMLDILADRGEIAMLGLRKGDSGPSVELLQTMLTAAGFTVKIDGQYGASTSAALLALRKSIGSSATSGDSVSPSAYEQLFRVHAARQAKTGPRGPQGEPGPAGPTGPAGPPGRDGLGVGDAVTVTGAITATA